MARNTKQSQIEELTALLCERDAQIARDASSMRGMREQIKDLQASAEATPDENLAKVAKLICPEKPAGTVGWDDVRQILVEREYERATLRTTLVDLASKLDIPETITQHGSKRTRDEQELLDKVDTEICGLLSDLEDLQAVPKNWRDWQELMESETSPDDVAAMRETLEILGIDGWKMRYVLAHSGGPRAALKLWD
jgi:hypothetical protein